MRKNTKNSQANFYFISSLGLNETSNYSYGVQGDWETREYFLGSSIARIVFLIPNFMISMSWLVWFRMWRVWRSPYMGNAKG